MEEQLRLKLPLKNSKISHEDFILGDFNRKAYNFLFQQFAFNNSSQVVFIYGEKSVGKSYLTKLYLQDKNGKILTFTDIAKICKQSSLLDEKYFLLEDIETLSFEQEKLLFHFYNLIVNSDSKLILTANKPPKQLKLTLPDLQSRLLQADYFVVEQPEGQALKLLLFKLFNDAQLKVDMSIINYILKHNARSAENIRQLVLKISDNVWVKRYKLSINDIKKFMIE